MSPEAAAEGSSVLVLAPFGQDAASIESLLAGGGYRGLVCSSADGVAAALDDSTGAVLMTDEALHGDLTGLAAAARAQPTWSDVPFVLLAARQIGSTRGSDVTRMRLPEFAANAIILERPLSSMSLLSAVGVALRSRRKQFEMRDRMVELATSAAALREESRALETLNRTGRQVAAELDGDKLVQAVVNAGTELTGAAIGAFLYNRLDENGESHTLSAFSGVSLGTSAELSSFRGKTVFDPNLFTGGVVRSDDISDDPHSGEDNGHGDLFRDHLTIASYLAVPVVSRSGPVIGGLFFGHAQPGVFTDRSERLSLGLAAQAAIAMDNARLFQATQRANQTLEDRVVERTAALNAEMANRVRVEAALHQSQKMEAVGQLTGGIAHDFNNMLTGIIGSLDLMRRRLDKGRTDGLDRYMAAASSSAQRAAALTQRLLAFSRRQSLDPQPVDVGQLVQSLADLLRRTISERVVLNIVASDEKATALADANQLESAILNLAINARDAMPDGGQLTVETGSTTLGSADLAGKPGLRPGRYVVVAVSDTGVGMSSDILARAFDPFFTTKPIGQGTGLGLSMVYGFAQQSNGQVRIHSRPGQGTSVKIFLPVADAPAVSPDSAEPIMTALGAGRRILVVEDDASVRLLIRTLLEELDYVPVVTGEPQDAVKILASGQLLDLMVSDVGLPGMNGRQLAEIAREHRPGLPILFVTGYAENAAIRAGFLGTNMDMITKPFSADRLAGKIQQMLGLHPVT